jgi:hypothetical protein
MDITAKKTCQKNVYEPESTFGDGVSEFRRRTIPLNEAIQDIDEVTED